MTTNELPTEEEAQAEIANIDRLLEEAKVVTKRLRERRDRLVPISESTNRKLAVTMHAVFCDNAHGGTGLTCNFTTLSWDSWSVTTTRSLWVAKATRKFADSGEDVETFLVALRTLASNAQLVTIDSQLMSVAAVERKTYEKEDDERQ